MKRLYKILIAVGVAIMLAAAGYFIWWLFIEKPAPETPGTGGTLSPGTGGSPVSTSTAPGNATLLLARAISDHKAFDYWLVSETGEIYYLTPEGYVYTVKEGPDLEISRQAIMALNRTEPSSDGRRLLASFGSPSAPQWAIFDTADSVWRPLPSQVVNAGWGRTPHELVASVASGNDLNLSFVDISRTPPVYTLIVRDFRIRDAVFSPLENGEILIAERPSASYEGSMWRLNPATRSLTLILAPSAGRMVKVERGANLAYVSDASEFSITNGVLQNPTALFFQTFPDKCAAAANTVYCFAPRNIGASTVLPDDYLMRAFYSIDSLYTIAYPSFTITPRFIQGSFDASRVRADKNAVYFIDRYTDRLHELRVP